MSDLQKQDLEARVAYLESVIRDMTDWRPMSTAPKDGTRIQVLCSLDATSYIYVAYWSDGLDTTTPRWVCEGVGGDYSIDSDKSQMLGWLPQPSGTNIFVDFNDPDEVTKPDHQLSHIDDFIDGYPRESDPPGSNYARWFFFLARLSAAMRAKFTPWVKRYELYCTYEGRTYRVTGASRFGDVFLQENLYTPNGYQHRVDLKQCSKWRDKP